MEGVTTSKWQPNKNTWSHTHVRQNRLQVKRCNKSQRQTVYNNEGEKSSRRHNSYFFLNALFTLFIYLFIFGCVGSSFLCEGFLQFLASGGHSSSRCAGLPLSRPLPLRSRGSRRAGSVIVAHGPSCSAACGIFPDQGSNPCVLHWQADSQPLRHQGSPITVINM